MSCGTQTLAFTFNLKPNVLWWAVIGVGPLKLN